MAASDPRSNGTDGSSTDVPRSPARRGTLTELFSKGTPPSSFPLGSTAAAQSNRRRTSITASLGLNTASGSWSNSALNSFNRRRGSSSVSASDMNESPFSPSSLDEAAVEEDCVGRMRSGSSANEPSTPSSPYARRMSFGTRAYESVAGFNWNDHSRQRAESTVERGIGSRIGMAGKRLSMIGAEQQQQPQPKPETKVQERPMPTPILKANRQLDHHEDRMVKGEYMMD